MKCSVGDCVRTAESLPSRRGMCGAHWMRWKRHGDATVGGPIRTMHHLAVMPTAEFRRFLRDRGETVASVFSKNKAMQRLAEKPAVSIYGADKLACAIDVHPYCIWPEWFDLPVEEAS